MVDIEYPDLQFFQTLNWTCPSVQEVVKKIANYLEDTGKPNHVIYFHGWNGLGASAVLKSAAKDPPPSLRRQFDSIIHIDCSRWKNRREIQRIIAQELQLPAHVMDMLSRQDEEDDFAGVDDGSRAEMRSVGAIINKALRGLRWLVVFHNGSNRMVNFNDFGIPQPDQWLNGMVLWTYSGRLRGIPGLQNLVSQRMDEFQRNAWGHQHTYFTPIRKYSLFINQPNRDQGAILHTFLCLESLRLQPLIMLDEEATEIAEYTNKLGVISKIAPAFCRYLISLNSMGGDSLDFNWPTHASNYWVCDGITQECQQNEAWELAAALHEQMLLGDFSSHRVPYVRDTKRWIVAASFDAEVQPEVTSFFLTKKEEEHIGRIWRQTAMFSAQHTGKVVPNKMFQRAEQLHVLKLCHCFFSFSSPPFLHCRTIRFLGLDNCWDQDEDEDKDSSLQRQNDFFQSLYVLDICDTNWELSPSPNKLERMFMHMRGNRELSSSPNICDTDWELSLSPNITERMAMNMREISIKRGRIWHVTHAWTWRNLQNVHKLRVIEPTCPWETGSEHQFTGMVKLELLDLSGNRTMQVLPSLSGSTSLSNLILDGCTGLKHVLPGTLPPSLETFSFDAGAGKQKGKGKPKISCISMAGCSRLVNFRLCGSLVNLVELDLSDTLIKAVDLREEIVQVPSLRHVIMVGCKRLHAILWPQKGIPKLTVMCIDTRGGEMVIRSKISHDSLVCPIQGEHCHARVSVSDMRFIQSLVLAEDRGWMTGIPDTLNLNLCLTCSKDDGKSYTKDTMVPYSSEQSAGSALHKSLIPRTHQTYSGINIDKATVDIHGSSAQRFEPLRVHIDIGEGIITNIVTKEAVEAVTFVMDRVESLVVHDNSSITTVTPVVPGGGELLGWNNLKLCSVERCCKLDTVFTVDFWDVPFGRLETFWAVELLMARCIWSRKISIPRSGSFEALRAVHIHLCPRLTFVLQLPWYPMCCLEILQIICCGDLTHVFPNPKGLYRGGVLEFPNLKNIHLYELPKLQQICDSEVKIFAPSLETITVRGCWSLKRLPVTNLSSKGDRSDNCPIVDCEKDWWEKLEWDGTEQGHHHSLFKQRHSKYYKKTMLRRTVLR